MKSFNIPVVSRGLEAQIQQKIDSKTKPLGALGRLEKIALQVALIQQSFTPKLVNPHILVFAADHGITNEGVSAYPQDVTWQMVHNFVQGGAAINVFAKQNNIRLTVVDAGVNHVFSDDTPIVHAKITAGTKSFLRGPALTQQECEQALLKGAAILNDVYKAGCNAVGFGEMGIGNTSSAAVLMSLLCKLPIEMCVGRGTGLTDEQLNHKIKVLADSVKNNYRAGMESFEIMTAFGGAEIVMMCGAMLQAAENGMLILVDGFISSAAFLCAYNLNPAILTYAIFCHCSDENGHAGLLQYLGAEPVLKLNMRLGEGTGCAIVYPIIKSAVAFLNEMASFESAGVSNK